MRHRLGGGEGDPVSGIARQQRQQTAMKKRECVVKGIALAHPAPFIIGDKGRQARYPPRKAGARHQRLGAPFRAFIMIGEIGSFPEDGFGHADPEARGIERAHFKETRKPGAARGKGQGLRGAVAIDLVRGRLVDREADHRGRMHHRPDLSRVDAGKGILLPEIAPGEAMSRREKRFGLLSRLPFVMCMEPGQHRGALRAQSGSEEAADIAAGAGNEDGPRHDNASSAGQWAGSAPKRSRMTAIQRSSPNARQAEEAGRVLQVISKARPNSVRWRLTEAMARSPTTSSYLTGSICCMRRFPCASPKNGSLAG